MNRMSDVRGNSPRDTARLPIISGPPANESPLMTSSALPGSNHQSEVLDFTRTRRQEQLREEYCAAGRKLVRGTAAARDAGQTFERSLWRQVAETGLFGLHLPEPFGGRGWSIAETAAVLGRVRSA